MVAWVGCGDGDEGGGGGGGVTAAGRVAMIVEVGSNPTRIGSATTEVKVVPSLKVTIMLNVPAETAELMVAATTAGSTDPAAKDRVPVIGAFARRCLRNVAPSCSNPTEVTSAAVNPPTAAVELRHRP